MRRELISGLAEPPRPSRCCRSGSQPQTSARGVHKDRGCVVTGEQTRRAGGKGKNLDEDPITVYRGFGETETKK